MDFAFRKILVPTDLSDDSLYALPHAIQFVERFHSSLLVVHFVQSLASIEPARRRMTALQEQYSAYDCRVLMEVGDPGRHLASVAELHQVDLIVMSRRARPEARTVGSVTATVLRRAPCPVLACRFPARNLVGLQPVPADHPEMRGLKPLRRILHATDYSAVSRMALEHAVEVAHSFSASLELLHVIERSDLFSPPYYRSLDRAHAVDPRFEELFELRDAVARRYPSMEILLTGAYGRAPVAITAIALEKSADLLVLGTHSRRGVARLLLGSTAESVLGRATCPVLIAGAPSQVLAGGAIF